MTRRSLLAIALAAALLLSGCVEITNPQFDARYAGNTKHTYGVFAVWQYDSGVNPPIGSRVSELIVADVARPSSAVTVALAGAHAVSDVRAIDGIPRVLAAEGPRIAEVDLTTRRISVVASPTLPGNAEALGAIYGRDGALVSWYESPDMTFTVVRKARMSAEQTASVSFRDVFGATVPPRDWRSPGRPGEMMFLAADDATAYFVSSSPMPGDASFLRTTVWRADFASHTISEVGLGGDHRFPPAFGSPRHTHADRAVRRFGVPVEGVPNQIVFLSLTGGVRAVSSVPSETSGNGLVVQPGGERYLVGRWLPEYGKSGSGGSATLAQGSFAQTSTVPLLRKELSAAQTGPFALAPVGLIGSVLAYSEATSAPPNDGALLRRLYGSYPDVQLRFYDTLTRKDSAVATVTGSGGPVRIDFLGSYVR